MRRFLLMCVACVRGVREWSRCSPFHPAAPLRAAPATKSSRDRPPRPVAQRCTTSKRARRPTSDTIVTMCDI
jgi:hypothetical protein